MAQKIANNARALLTGSILATDTSIAIEVAKADSFPVANTGTDPIPTTGKDYFKAVLQDTSGNIEIVYVRTRAAGSAILSNVIRGREGTTALAFAAGSVVGLRLTAADHEQALNTLVATRGAFIKADTQSVAFTKTGAGTVSLKAGTYVGVEGTLITFAAATAVTMPALTAGTDYAIYACTDGTVRADANFSAPTGYTTANSRKIGGFHYSPGGHSGVSGGGNATPQINEYSFWDLKFKPACPDPRGMVLVADGFWADIYLLGVDHLTNGSSKYNVTIGDGGSPPKVPTKFGGNGTTAYTSLNWWEAGEVMAHHGKRLPNYAEFAALAFGTTEASSIGVDPVSTTWAAAYISKWGCAQASGNLWVWGANFGGGAAAAAWAVNTVGRGSTYQMENAAIFGGYWGETSSSGSRCSNWSLSPTYSASNIGARGVCDLLILE